MESGINRAVKFAAIAAAVLFASAVYAFGAALEGFVQAQHPVALLGARGFPHALAFNLIAFVLPGMLAGVVALALRERLPRDANWPVRIGAQLVFLSALAFIAMGLLPLDPNDLESNTSRMHGTAWILWSVAFIPGALLLAFGLWRDPLWGRFARISVVGALGVVVSAYFLTALMAPGIGQRIAFGLWFAWLVVAGMARSPK